jgi:hypothetical protein
VAIADHWKDLRARRFPELPLDCGNDEDPGIIYSEDLRDWSDKATTPDQRRIERYIDRFDLRGKSILHIGIGNSGLARRFHRRVGHIVGTTIDPPEVAVAEALGLGNYAVVRHNKYSGGDGVPGRFDLILDNNPTSPCCCLRHLGALFDFYSDKLAEGGLIVTDREGLGWIPDGANPRWSFAFDDLAAVASVEGFAAYRANRNVFVLARGPLPGPEPAALARHLLRQVASVPRRAAGSVVRGTRRVLRRFDLLK